MFNTVASQFVYPMNDHGNEESRVNNGDSEVNDSADIVMHENRYEP